MSRILTVAPATKGSTTISFVPQLLIFKLNGTIINRIRVTSQGLDTLADLSGDAVKFIGQSMRMSPIATDVGYIVPIANGYIPRNLDISLDVGAGPADVEVFGFSYGKGTATIVSTEQTILANTLGKFSKFSKVYFDYDDNDRMTITTNEGSNDEITAEEISAYNATIFNQTAGATEFCVIDNSMQLYKEFQITPATNKTMVVSRIGSSLLSNQNMR
jgi:hypothetical protein